MEPFLTLKTNHLSSSVTTIEIDNTTGYKDFKIIQGVKDEVRKSKFTLSGFAEDETLCLEIGEVTLIGREVELLKEFLNQKS